MSLKFRRNKAKNDLRSAPKDKEQKTTKDLALRQSNRRRWEEKTNKDWNVGQKAGGWVILEAGGGGAGLSFHAWSLMLCSCCLEILHNFIFALCPVRGQWDTGACTGGLKPWLTSLGRVLRLPHHTPPPAGT